ncbi:hypothetical protein [Sporosarcina limicola]|uniref:Uncharacterized protein n=1 Tax=Sporosarcina limicola TaxID=34101 RepID=A0A927RBG7_9BACL|nr:hypothetical protein [Sporosarcina limicola]MBE1553365.1 hypothetical protein [Sporosarcina limicola]
MKWQEVREIFPDQYVLLSILDSHSTKNKKIVDEVALIRPIEGAEEATKALMNAEKNTIVYHTKNEQIVVEIRRPSALRGSIR